MFPKRFITLVFSFSLLLFSKPSSAQITITASDLGQHYKVGNIITQSFDTLSEIATLDIGMPGGGNTWDFSKVPLSVTTQLQMVLDPTSTPGVVDFSNANRSIFFELEDEDGKSDAYNYLNLTNDGIDFLGTWGVTSVDGETLITKITYNPVQQISPLPLTLNDTWSYQGTQTINTVLDGMNFPFSSDEVNNTYEVDAYGTIILPDGTNEAALRIKQILISEFELIPGFAFVDSTLNFLFLTQSGTTLSIEAESINMPDQGMIQGSLTWSSSSAVTSTENLEVLGFKLPAIIPNPIRQNTMVDYTLPAATAIQISLFDQRGRLVQTLFNGQQGAGPNRVELEVTNLANGLYYLSLMAQKGVITRKIMVQH